MDAKHVGLFDLAERRLAWATRRQSVLAQNIANANTPGYKPHDLRPFSVTNSTVKAIAPARTQLNHLAGSVPPMAANEVIDRAHMKSPDGNAVAMEEQLVKLADTEATHRLVTTIYRKYRGMLLTAAGRAPAG